MTRSAYEAAIRRHLARLPQSASHSEESHLDRVLAFAERLRGVYGGDADIVVAAVLLHDLGRSDTGVHGPASAQLSAERARDILAAVDFPPELVAPVLQAIAEHDQPEVRPTTLEGRILKDADFLAGLGAVGVVRSAMWTGESGQSHAELVDRLVRKMPARIASLEFTESRRHAAAEYAFVALFASRLVRPPSLDRLPPAPYVVFEGISGTGKSTQVELLAARLARSGSDPLLIREPGPWFGQARRCLPDGADPAADLALLLGDRLATVAPSIRKAWAAGRPVIADRSYVSSMVYQVGDDGPPTPEDVAHMHRHLPQPTSIIVLDVEPAVAWARVSERLRRGQGRRGSYESLEQFEVHRRRFLELTRVFPLMHVLDATVPPDRLHEQVWRAVVRDLPALDPSA